MTIVDSTASSRPGGIIATRHSPYARLHSADLSAVTWLPGFWQERFRQCHEVTLPLLDALMSDPRAGHAVTNLRIAAGLEEGEFAGTHWQDEWVYKWIEAAAYAYTATGDARLDRRMDELIAVIASAQQPDGYIASQVTVRGWPRFQQPQHHELYVMGHLMTAACAHYRATGKGDLLTVARKAADYLYATFMPRPPEFAHIQNNTSQIMGLVELYRTVGDLRYLDLATLFIDMHGARPGGTDLRQDRVPLRAETQVVGHAVFFTYLYCGATDAYLETGDESLRRALRRLWDDLTTRRMYVHGGVCAVHRGFSVRPRALLAGRGADAAPAVSPDPDGFPSHLTHVHVDDVHEAAGGDYELPNSMAYNETCAQIGSGMWNWRLLTMTGDAAYAELLEHTLHNSVLSDIGLDGASWFYTNPLRWYGAERPLLSQDAYRRFQPGRVHVCCPSNLARTIAGLHGYVYAVSDEGLWVNLYGASRFDGTLDDGTPLRLTQRTAYPWDGAISIRVEAAPDRPFALKLRIPSWAAGAAITVNGVAGEAPAEPGTYAELRRRWKAGDVVELRLPMPVRLLEGHPRIEAARNHVAVMRGPLVYCLESPDLPPGVQLANVQIPLDTPRTLRHDPDHLGGVTVLDGEAAVSPSGEWAGALYREVRRTPSERWTITLIPYYAWANRGVSEMAIWLPALRGNAGDQIGTAGV